MEYDDVPPWRAEWREQPPAELERKLRRESRERRLKKLKQLERQKERVMKEERRLERERREDEERKRRYNPCHDFNVGYYVPRPQESSFPWNSPISLPEHEPQPYRQSHKKTAVEAIENLYYEHYPEEMPKQMGALRRDHH